MSCLTITTRGAPSGNVLLTGRVTPYREYIKEIFGAQWNSNLQGWLISEDKTAELIDWISDCRRHRRKCSDTEYFVRSQELIPDDSRRKRFTVGCICTDTYTCLKCRYACCEEAVRQMCVCLYCFKCEKHGIDRQCHGSHD